MKHETKKTIYLVDDDAVLLRLMEMEFMEQGEYNIQTFATGELCMTAISGNPDVIILDYHLDGIDKNAMNGMETLDQIKAYNDKIPVIMLSSQDKIEVAINCMHHKAVDYVVKSETAFMRLQKIITNVLHYQRIEKELSWYMDRM